MGAILLTAVAAVSLLAGCGADAEDIQDDSEMENSGSVEEATGTGGNCDEICNIK